MREYPQQLSSVGLGGRRGASMMGGGGVPCGAGHSQCKLGLVGRVSNILGSVDASAVSASLTRLSTQINLQTAAVLVTHEHNWCQSSLLRQFDNLKYVQIAGGVCHHGCSFLSNHVPPELVACDSSEASFPRWLPTTNQAQGERRFSYGGF